MNLRTFGIIIVIILFAILLIQNSGMAALRFYFWQIYAPQFILVFLVFGLGFLVGFMVAKSARKRVKETPAPAPPKPQA